MSVSVTIVICTRNRANHLEATLESLNRLVIPEHLVPELVVVDNGSTDATQEVLNEPPVENMPVRSVIEPRKGTSRARNTGLREAEGRILLWLDDDIRVLPDWLTCLTRPLLEETAEAVAGKVVLPPHLNKAWMQPFHRAALASTESIDADPDDIVSANMAFSRSVLTDVPGFDPELGPGQLGTMEDTLFSRQLREAGYRLRMVTETAVEHHFDELRLTRDAFIDLAVARGRSLSYIRYHWLHHSVEDWTHRRHAYQIWRHPRFVLAKRLVDRAAQRCARWLKQGDAPISKGEFWTVMNVYSLKQYLRERTRPRNYAERGLEKLHGVQPTESRSERRTAGNAT